MLRDGVANSINPLRGMSVRTENCGIVPDDYREIDIISRLLTYRSKRVAVEDPCDAGHYYLLSSQGVQVTPIPVDDQGIIVEKLADHDVTSVFVTAPLQQPTGVTTSRSRKLESLQWADRTGGHIVEWDTFGEFCYDESPLPSLFLLDKTDRVIYLNMFTSWIGSGSQPCYVVLPSGLMSQLLTIRNFLNPEPSWLNQRVAAVSFQAIASLAISGASGSTLKPAQHVAGHDIGHYGRAIHHRPAGRSPSGLALAEQRDEFDGDTEKGVVGRNISSNAL